LKTVCGCGLRMRDYGGVDGVAIEECPSCSESGGAYNKSPYWDTKRDKEDERKMRAGMAYKDAMDKVVPLDQTRQGKKRGRRAA
jgi:predicted RNA-binding protein with PUA-like domain